MNIARPLCAALGLALLLASCGAPADTDGSAAFSDAARRAGATFQPSGFLVIAWPDERDYVAVNRSPAGPDDLLVGIDLADLMQAGLDPARLDPAAFRPAELVYDLPTSTLVLSFDLGSAAYDFARQAPKDGKAPDEVRALMAEIARSTTGMARADAAADIRLFQPGSGLSLYWPATPAEKGTWFGLALDPSPLLAAGLDPSRLRRWTLAPAGSPLAGRLLVEARYP